MKTTKRALVSSAALAVSAALLVACGSRPSATESAARGSPAAGASAYYQDDGPPNAIPADIDRIADAQPKDEPLHRFANRPYNVFGVTYTPLTQRTSLTQRGVASWYGRKYHGQKTAIGETYDMLAMSAAHPTAPLPSFARVTSMASGRSVIVRVNDRGPFLAGRIVDLSYAAAHRIGVAQAGSGEVIFELLLPPFSQTNPPVTIDAQPLAAPAVPFAVATAAPVAASGRPFEPRIVESQQTPAAPSVTANAPFVPVPSAVAPTQSNTTPRGNSSALPGMNKFFVQLGAFGNFANAQAFQARMRETLSVTPMVRQSGGLFRVQLGPFNSMDEAQAARNLAQPRVGTTLPIVSDNTTP